MPVHDWTVVDAGIFHAFHTTWIAEIQIALNNGVLPQGYYALAEQHAGQRIADVLTLHASPASAPTIPALGAGGGAAVAEAPPKVRRKESIDAADILRRRTLAIRHVSGHHLVAILEIVSPANKDRLETVDGLTAKVVSALDSGVHVLLIDLFPPGPHDPHGMHCEVRQRLSSTAQSYTPPADEPVTLASYAAGPRLEIYIEHAAVGAALPGMPLFLQPGRYVNVPLDVTYQAAYRGMPAFWREILEARA